MVLEKTLESPWDCKEIQPVHSEGDQSWVFFGRNDAKAETPVLWPPHAKSWLIGKDSDAGRAWGQEEKGTTEDKMAGWHHRLYGHEFEWVNSGSWWWTGRPGMLRFMGSQRVGHDWATELNWTEIRCVNCRDYSWCSTINSWKPYPEPRGLNGLKESKQSGNLLSIPSEGDQGSGHWCLIQTPKLSKVQQGRYLMYLVFFNGP